MSNLFSTPINLSTDFDTQIALGLIELSTSGPSEPPFRVDEVIPSYSDVKFTAINVSGSNTVCEASFKGDFLT